MITLVHLIRHYKHYYCIIVNVTYNIIYLYEDN